MHEHIIEQIGKFEILGELGKGAGSVIFKIRRTSDFRIYAMKQVQCTTKDDFKYLTQLEHEYTVGTRFNHENLVKVYAIEKIKKMFKVTGGRLLIEFVDGLPLSKCENLPVGKLIKIFFYVSNGLYQMHKLNICHADIKPDNVLVKGTDVVKVIDYGLAWEDGDQKERVQGTLEYLAPEQAKSRKVTKKTDIFNFGALMRKMFTGQIVPPEYLVSGASRIGKLDNLIRPIRELNDKVPKEMDDLILHCLAYRPDNRPETMKSVRERLYHIYKQQKKLEKLKKNQ